MIGFNFTKLNVFQHFLTACGHQYPLLFDTVFRIQLNFEQTDKLHTDSQTQEGLRDTEAAWQHTYILPKLINPCHENTVVTNAN